MQKKNQMREIISSLILGMTTPLASQRTMDTGDKQWHGFLVATHTTRKQALEQALLTIM
jgi:hypothetical protein